VLLSGAVEVNVLTQEALRQFTQWLWIENPTFQLRGGYFATELCRPNSICRRNFCNFLDPMSRMSINNISHLKIFMLSNETTKVCWWVGHCLNLTNTFN